VTDALVIWDDPDDPDGNVAHFAEHGLTMEEVLDVLMDPDARTGVSRSSDRAGKFGWTTTGNPIVVFWDLESEEPEVIYPVTAYEVPPPH
jgi:hypothetical protein